jgi:hypothetical protein
LVDSLTITRCWQKGFKEVVEKDRWTKSLELIQDIQVLASSIVRNPDTQIQELMDIKNFIHPLEERVVDSEVEISERIIAHYSLSTKDQDEEVGV